MLIRLVVNRFLDFCIPKIRRTGSSPVMACRWIGARVGLFCTGTQQTHDSGYADLDRFRITKPVH